MLEILAPCGSFDSLTAALNSGADAVYLGLDSFSARKNAANFTAEQLCEAVKLCHLSGVKVNVTMNTLVRDDELPALEKAIEDVAASKADAMIVQDFAVAELAKKIEPKLRLHASTQMTITGVSGAEFARKNGFSRVVLARELSKKQIEEIVRNVDIETEVFVHGALCVCVSGQCYMSAMLGGRSGNRGLCAQPCRLNFNEGGRENILSLKDLSVINNLRELQDIGVTSAKIEGRMKRPEYVAAAVTQCRKALAGEEINTELLENVFSRSGFTQGYYNDNFKSMQGVRTKEDVISAPKAFSQLHELYKAPFKRFKVDFEITAEESEPLLCTAKTDGIEISVSGEAPQKALNRETTAEEIVERMNKLGGTVYSAGKTTVKCAKGLSVSAAVLNDLRRKAVNALSEAILEKNTLY